MKIMTFKTKLASLFSLMLISLITVQAQDAKALLDEVSSKVKSYDNILIDFKYSLDNAKEQVKQDTRGNITLKGEYYFLALYNGTVEQASPKRIDLAIGCNLAIKNANAELGIGFSAHPLIITGQSVKSFRSTKLNNSWYKTVSNNSKSPTTTFFAKGVTSAAISIKAQEGIIASTEQVMATKEFLY